MRQVHHAIQLFADFSEMDALKAYLKMSNTDKGKDLAYSFGNMFVEFLEDHYPELREGMPEELIADPFGEDLVNHFANTPQVFEEFYRDFSSSVQFDADMPSYLMLEYQRDVDDEWLVHATNNPGSIVKNGFTKGMADFTTLSLTTWFNDERKVGGGFNFAFEAKSVSESSIKKYGKQAVIFRASGIEVYHWGDEERQVIFLGNTAEDIHGIYGSRNDGWSIVGEDEEGNEVDLVKGYDLRECVRKFLKTH